MVAFKSKLKLFTIFGKYLSLINNVQFQPFLIDKIESLCIDGIVEIYRTDNIKSKISLNLNFPMLF